jgi:hypothetical protein
MQLTHVCNVFKQPLHTQLAMRAKLPPKLLLNTLA